MASAFSLKRVSIASLLSTVVILRTTTLAWTSALTLSFGFGLLFWIIYYSFVYPFYISPLRHIPTVPGSALIGHAHIRLAHEVGVPEREWHNKYGLVIRYFLPFGFERLSIADVDALREIHLRNSDNFVKPARVRAWMKGTLGEKGVLLVEGEEHARQRKALAPAFSTSSIRALEPQFWEKGLLMCDLLGKEIKTSSGERLTVEILGWLNRAGLDIICSAAFDYKVDSLLHPHAALRKAYADIFAFDLVSFLVMGLRLYFGPARYLPVQINRDLTEGDRVITEVANEIVQRKMNASSNEKTFSKDILSLVVKHNECLAETDLNRLSFETIRDEIKTFVGAGHETTATAVAWTIDLLSKHPDIQAKLRQEILATIPTLASSPADPEYLASLNIIDTLPYLSKVCQESLRFIPPAPTTSRENLKDTHLGGYYIPAGAFIFIMPNAINHLSHYWGPNADVFDPERWDKLPEGWSSSAFQTFLEGPKGCIGRRFAEVEMRVLIACLISRFVFERGEAWEDQEKVKQWRLVLKPRDGIHVKMGFAKGV